ncbi:MAG: hypothetical protein ABI867_40995 [Kofleriaceae bacterium]
MKRALVFWALAACGDNQLQPDAAPVPIDADDTDAPPDANPLATLQGTGLCDDAACMQINPDAHEYEPRFQLWADTATKKRWIFLPPGTQIDTTDMNHWVFPVGTKLWKEFTRDSIRVETRLVMKTIADDDAPGAWTYITYAWNTEQNATTPVGNQAIVDANGTGHDIPSRSQCRECHEGVRPSRVLGFQALSLDFNAPAGLLDLQDLIDQNLLTAPPTTGTAAARFPLTSFTAVERNALTYMHANCGHCHNATSGTHDTTPIDVRLDVTKLTRATAPSILTTVDVDAAMPFVDDGTNYTKIIVSGSPQTSNTIFRMNSVSFRHMPKVGSELVDPDGQTALLAWINSL